ncbi:MAG: hypothetical protein Q9168_004744 [Polycauliona sp. 1 TL-2023]
MSKKSWTEVVKSKHFTYTLESPCQRDPYHCMSCKIWWTESRQFYGYSKTLQASRNLIEQQGGQHVDHVVESAGGDDDDDDDDERLESTREKSKDDEKEKPPQIAQQCDHSMKLWNKEMANLASKIGDVSAEIQDLEKEIAARMRKGR